MQRRINIIAHATGWILLFSLVVAFVYNPDRVDSVLSLVFSGRFLVFSVVYLFLFYLNMYWLMPALYLKQRHVFYFLSITLLFAAVYFIKPFDNLIIENNELRGAPPGPPPAINNESLNRPKPPGPGGGPGQKDIVSIILFLTVWSLSSALCIIRQWRITTQRMMQAETDKANAELSFLKAQINPHFLFNTLNNIYALVVAKNEKAGEGIMKLSNIMRYVTDEVKDDFVSLEGELNCVKDYIDLQKLRLNEKTTVQFETDGNTIDIKIAPLLLMTFVENAFKYGASNHEPAAITIRVSMEGSVIHFFCQNNLFESTRNTDRTGIGIQNAKQRLQHLYPRKHSLEINTANGLFTVQLRLQA